MSETSDRYSHMMRGLKDSIALRLREITQFLRVRNPKMRGQECTQILFRLLLALFLAELEHYRGF